ncbi:MAG: bifunctional acetate--CoA ligase family protein/GNAT family N-acetyltransferase [Burkholderiaceae bacterium]|nr:bifunctional acetate--CoA ligase family protein/GNAT family N-acetyltransferase [Burkholderiaceae bacterium]
MDKHYLSSLFSPHSIVVFAGEPGVAESQSTTAQQVVKDLQEGGFAGPITFLDIGMRGTLSDLAHSRADLAVIALPSDQLLAALEVAGRIQCKAAMIVGSGIDAALSGELQAIARQHGMYLLGPNCMGFQRPKLKLNASSLGRLAQPGAIALVSQSGALCASTLDWAIKNGVGFSAVVSLGRNAVVDIAHVLDFLAEDRDTHSIVVYLEGIRDARRFMSALRAAASAKPVIVLKSGRKPAGSKAALTHSGAIVGSDEVFDAALRRAGAVRVRAFVQLFSAAKCLSSRYLPVGKRLAIISNGGGPGVLAADWVNDRNLALATLPANAVAALAPQLSPLATLHDLIDLAEDADAAHFRAAVGACSKLGEVDGILVILSPKPGLDSSAIAQALADLQPSVGKPLITCWMGEDEVSAGRHILNAAAIPTFRTPEAAVDAFNNIASFHQNQQMLHQVPPPLSQLAKPDIEGARLLIENVLAERRKVLTEMESKALLSSFHIPVTKTILARSANEAILVANQLGYPVALKIDSPDISHKSDVHGVVLNVPNATAVRDTWQDMMATVSRLRPDAQVNGVSVQNMSGKPEGREFYIGVITDEPFGPVIAFGAGGTMIELISDRAIELPPLNQFLAHRLIDRVRASEMLGPWRGAAAVNRDALEQILLRVSEMVCALPQLREMDINPVIADANGALVVDARIVVERTQASPGNYQHLAILPYPSDRETEWPMRNGSRYIIRPVHPHDAEMLQSLVRGLSPESRYFRYFSSMHELSDRMLARFTLIDYDREMALVAIYPERKPNAEGGFDETERIIGVSRYVTNPDKSTCEFALVVADEFSGQGIGSRMMLAILDVARSKGLATMEGLVLTKNVNMLKLMRALDFQIKPSEDDPDVKLCTKAL